MERDYLAVAHKAGEVAYRAASRRVWSGAERRNPYQYECGFDQEAWAWDLGWRLAEFCAKGGG